MNEEAGKGIKLSGRNERSVEEMFELTLSQALAASMQILLLSEKRGRKRRPCEIVNRFEVRRIALSSEQGF